ncbi:lipolytic enzyme / transcription regulator protein (plasmid) [Legionella adelaidensis]|uniref:Lipolytic enzyme / transcription regulator protein n=2 Tax=Legionella adelaidensis TaxID=45056 RepID=A0A448NDG4_9GAMM|nr:helix-turn-helix transcriptional regulator [Legionella adelaidensis]VEH85964.1 lipolytic enzyme / transcription regulator protein [Legionella adelaidensis]
MSQKSPYILSLIYREKITELCKSLGKMDLTHFAMYIIFNDKSTFALSNVFPFLKSYYQEELYKEDYTVTPHFLNFREQGYYLCSENFSGSERLKKILENNYSLYPVFNIVRHHSECTFVFSAIRNTPCETPHSFYQKTLSKFETFCTEFVDGCLDIIVNFNPHYQFSFILNDKALRDAVIKRGYEEDLQLTSRQLECLWLAMQGKSVKEIAKTLEISFFTVEKHFKNIREIFSCDSLTIAIYKAIQRGIIGKVSGIPSVDTKKSSSFARPQETID